MFQKAYYIDKSSNTFADSLAAFGLAFVLNRICDSRAQVFIEDAGPAYRIACSTPLQQAWVENCKFFVGVPFLSTFDKKTNGMAIKGTSLSPGDIPPSGDLLVDYQVERDNRTEYFAWLNSFSPEDRRKALRDQVSGPTAPHKDWDIFRAINPGALQSYNSLAAEWWRGQEAFTDLLQTLLAMTVSFPNDVDGAEASWTEVCKSKGWEKPKKATLSQLYNPAQGKGTNSPKTTWSNPNNLKGFWLLEWLKATGFYYGGFTRTIAKVKDRKTYVLVPCRLGWDRHMSVMKDFRESMLRSETAIKLDILVTLRYLKAFLQHYEEGRISDLTEELFGEKPADLVRGLDTVFYKDLGNAVATMNIASLNLPRWVAPTSPQSLVRFQQALEEHLNVVNGLDESRGDQFDLLAMYRDFLSASDLNPFFEFTIAYSGFIISQRERGKFVRQFTIENLEVLFMNSEDQAQTYSAIIQSEGFQNIAYAIRHSTVIPQWQKRRGSKARPAVDVRYGLGQQLARKAAYPDEFLAELGEFMHLYNAENAQLREKGRNPFRKNIREGDIAEIVDLLDRFGSKVVCNLLVAYGYASSSAEKGAEEPQLEEMASDLTEEDSDEGESEE